MNPKTIILFSGKRKSGKDFITDHLQKRLGDKRCEIIKISAPIKSYWANQNRLNLNELLSDGKYKEQHRLDMIKWSEEKRDQDYGYFCRAACENAADKPIWIVSDIRRKTDLIWFKEAYGDIVRKIRIVADEETRVKRGYAFQDGVDNAASECDLDDHDDWDLVIKNGMDRQDLEEQLNSIERLIPNL